MKTHCINFFNALDLGCQLKNDENGEIAFEFLTFKRASMEAFDALRDVVTGIVCRGSLTEEESFSVVVKRCPHLRFLDIGQSFAFSKHFSILPDKLEALDLSDCEWLNHKEFKQIIEICPRLNKICLAGNQQLKFLTWGLLEKLESLRGLDLSRCQQVADEDFVLILRSSKRVEFLVLSECQGLSDLSFFEIGKYIPNLKTLNISKTQVTDSGIVELSVHCKSLLDLNVKHCPHLTAKGILEILENLPSLKHLSLSNGVLTSKMLKSVKEQRPLLEIDEI